MGKKFMVITVIGSGNGCFSEPMKIFTAFLLFLFAIMLLSLMAKDENVTNKIFAFVSVSLAIALTILAIVIVFSVVK